MFGLGGLGGDILGGILGGVLDAGGLGDGLGGVLEGIGQGIGGGFGSAGGDIFSSIAPDALGAAGAVTNAMPLTAYEAPLLSPGGGPLTPGGGETDWLSKALGFGEKAVKYGVPALGAASGVMSIANAANQASNLRSAQQFERQTARPAAGAGQALTQAGQNAMLGGPLPPQLQAMVDQWKTDARNQFGTFLARSGISASSMAGQMDSWINNQAAQMKEAFAQQLLQSGYSGITTALGPSQVLGNQAMGVMDNLNKIIAGANRSLASLLGSTANT